MALAEHLLFTRADAARFRKAFGVPVPQEFDEFLKLAEWFHGANEREHPGQVLEHGFDAVAPPIREWHPRRFMVRDEVLGVMLSRFNRRRNAIEAAGFATREHRGLSPLSGARGLLTVLLADWATQAAEEVRFVRLEGEGAEKHGVTVPVPDSVVALAKAHDVDVDRTSGVIRARNAGDLLLALTMPVRALKAVAHLDAESSRRLCMAIHHGVWTSWEIAFVLEHGPGATALFELAVAPGVRPRWAATIDDLHGAVLAAAGVDAVIGAAEATDAITPAVVVAGHPFTAIVDSTTTTRWRAATRRDPLGGLAPFTERSLTYFEEELPPGRCVIAGMPERWLKAPWALKWTSEVVDLARRSEARAIVAIPDGVVPPDLPDVLWVTFRVDTAALDRDIWRRMTTMPRRPV